MINGILWKLRTGRSTCTGADVKVDMAPRSLVQRLGLPHQLPPAEVWRDAFAAWLLQHAVLVGLVTFWLALSSPLSGRSFFLVWTRWDGNWYADIARHGYYRMLQAAFYPLMPFLERALAPALGGSVERAGLLVANVACLGAFVLLRWLTELETDTVLARRTLLLLALYPVGMYLIANYTESLFLALALATFLAMRSQRWLLAVVCISLATLTRATGIALLLPYAVARYDRLHKREWSFDWARAREALRSTLPALLPLATFVGIHVALSVRFGAWDAVLRAEAHWSRHLDWPWAGLLTSMQMVVTHFPSIASVDLLFGLFWLGLACAMVAPSRWPTPKTAIVFTWACLLLVLATPVQSSGSSPLTSISRYLLTAFPCFVTLAQWSLRSRTWLYVLLIACIGSAVVCTRIYALGVFLA
jgi:hypothetical protein